MQHRSQRLSTKRRYLSAVLATGLSWIAAPGVFAQDGVLIAPSSVRLLPPGVDVTEPGEVTETGETAETGEAAVAEMVLAAPGNSTLEMRIARRPWLLEKLLNPGASEANKMTPPAPPKALPDPPSLNRLPSKPSFTQGPIDLGDDGEDGWQTRGQTRAPKLETAEQEPSLSLVQPATEYPATAPATVSPPTTRLRTQPITEPLSSPTSPMPSPSPLSPAPRGPIPLTDPPGMQTRNSRPAPTPAKVLSPAPVSDPAPALPLDPLSPLPQTDSRASRTNARSQPSDRPESEESAVRVGDELPSTNHVGDDGFDNEPHGGVSTSDTDEDGGERSGVVVRKLRIGRDGSPIDEPSLLAPFQHSIDDAMPIESTGEVELRSPQRALQDVEPEILGATPDARGESDRAMTKDAANTAAPKFDRDYTGYPLTEAVVTPNVARMQSSMRACLAHYYADAEVANERSNWGMMHAIMVYGIDTKVVVDRKTYSTIAWIAGNNACRGQRLLASDNGRIVVRSGVGLQGHQAQMLAVFSLCNVPDHYPLYADGQKFSMQDVIREEQLACKVGAELTFTLIGLAHYMDTDASWTSSDGETWDFERLIREELSQPIVGSACGGTHRLMGFAHALRKRRAEGKPIDGQWQRAEKFTEDFVDYAYRLQNRDGSMSTNWFEGREDQDSMDRKVQTTGHMVEWLLTLTPDSQLQNPRLVAAVRYLLMSLYNDRDHDWSIGPKGHALRSLAMYYERVYRPDSPPWRTPMTARSNGNSKR